MLFNSFSFLVFFPVVVFIYFILPRQKRLRNLWLLLASYFFYMSWNARYGLLLLFCTGVTYIAALWISLICSRRRKKSRRRGRFVLTLALCLVFCLLFYFKYTNFFVENLQRVCALFGVSLFIPSFDIVLPVGISFFTFQAAGYLIDVYRGDTKAEKDFIQYALFVSFFPQLVAGPIERSRSLLAQLGEVHTFDFDRARDGLYEMLWGYFLKMVIADRAAIFVDQIYNEHPGDGGVLIILATVLFAFQIYGDFGGYSMIARGAARVLGIDLMENFRSPYRALTTRDFWRRWHISLNTWFVDYVYIPLGGNRKGNLRKYFNTLFVFFLSGLWHGARWNFVIWGLLNGLYQIIGSIRTDRRIAREERANRFHTYAPKGPRPSGIGQDVYSFDGTPVTHDISAVRKEAAPEKAAPPIRQSAKEETLPRHFKWFHRLLTFVLIDIAWLFFRSNSLADAFFLIRQVFAHPLPASPLPDALFGYGLAQADMILLLSAILLLLLADLVHDKGLSIRRGLQKLPWLFRIVILSVIILFILIFGIWGNTYDAQSFIYFQF